MTDQFPVYGRSARLDRVLSDLLGQSPELQAAAVVSFDGLPMASRLPVGLDEDRVAAMSAALLSLGERAAENFGRGELNQIYVEGDNGTVFLVSADDEAVLVATGVRGAKVGLMLYEVRHAAVAVAAALRADDAAALAAQQTEEHAPQHAVEHPVVDSLHVVEDAPEPVPATEVAPIEVEAPVAEAEAAPVQAEPAPLVAQPEYYAGGAVEVPVPAAYEPAHAAVQEVAQEVAPVEPTPAYDALAGAWPSPAPAEPQSAETAAEADPEGETEPEVAAEAVAAQAGNGHANPDLGGWATYIPTEPGHRAPWS